MKRMLLLVAAITAAAAPAASAETPIVDVDRPTEIRSFAGIAAFSVYDPQDDAYRLVVSRGAAAPQTLPVAPRPVPFDADIGPDSAGEPAIVYSRCEREAPSRRGCDLQRYSLTRGAEAPIANADDDTASEYNPTIWKGRVAWARSYDEREDVNPVVYTRELTAPRARRSVRLPGIPTRRCSPIPSEGCGPTDGDVDELELYGRWLAASVTYEHVGVGGVCGRREVRLATLDGEVRQVGDHTCGLNGQSWVGLSFDAGRLYVARYCQADPTGCGSGRYGAFRYRLSTGDYALARFGRRLTGFSYEGDGRPYEVRAPDTDQGYCGNSLPESTPACEVVLGDALRFEASDAPR